MELKFNVLPLTSEMADIEIIHFLKNDGIGFFSKYMEPISKLMESMSPDSYINCPDIKYFRSFLDIYYFDNICIDNNQRWVYFAKAVNDNPNVLNLINIMERKSLFIENIIPYMDYYDILHLLVKKEFMDIINEKEILTRIHYKDKLNIIEFFRNECTREMTLEWLDDYISKNICYRSFVSLTGEQILNVTQKFVEMNKLNKQLLKVYFKGITDERRLKFKNSVEFTEDMTFLNKLFIILHKLSAICVISLYKLIKNLKSDLVSLEQFQEANNLNSIDHLIRIRMIKSLIEGLSTIDTNKELIIKLYSDETVKWLYTSRPKASDSVDDILQNFISFVKQPFIKLYFDKELYNVCRMILSKEEEDEDGNNSITKSNYIRGEIISLYTAYLHYQEYYLNIWLINDEFFMKNRLVELFIEFNDLLDEDASVYKNQTLEILKLYKNDHYIHHDKEITHRFSHLLLETYKSYYDSYLLVIKCLHNYDFNIPFSKDESQIIRRDSTENCILNAKWFQANIYSMYNLINKSPVIDYVLLPGTKEKFIVTVGNLLKIFTSDDRNDLKLAKNKCDEIFEPIQHLLNIFNMFIKFADNTQFQKGLIEETRFVNPEYIRKMLEVLLKKDKILVSEYNKIIELHNLINEEREKEMNDTNNEIPEEFLDPIMGALIEDPVYLPKSDIVMERDVILRHLLENQYNPFNREPLTKKELEEFNDREEIIAKITEFNEKKKHYVDID